MRFQFQNMKKGLKAELTTKGHKKLLIQRCVQAIFFRKLVKNLEPTYYKKSV